MITSHPKTDLEKTLEQRMEEKVQEIKNIENDIPGVIIIHDIRSWHVVYMSQRGRDFIDTSLEELQTMGPEYHSRFFNPEDSKAYAPQIFDFLNRNNSNEIISHLQQVRRSPDYDWAWFLSGVKIILWDNDNKPILTLATAIPLDAQHHIAAKAQRLLEENNFLRRNHDMFSKLTKQEKEVLKYLALGCSSTEIASKLFISEATANTHRRNVKSKLNAKNNYDLSMFARAFDLI